MKEKITVSFLGMDTTDALRDYAIEKLSKHDHLWELVSGADVLLSQRVNHRGVATDFKIIITAQVPKNTIHVEETGPDMYASIDLASDKFFRRLRRYYDKLSQWEGERPWKVVEVGEEDIEEVADLQNYVDYVPQIVERIPLENMTPMEEAEAIESMELVGRDQILFKNAQTGKISMIYKRRRGGYAIVEPGDDLE